MNKPLAWILLATGVSAAALPACLACNDIGCGGGFEWEAHADDGSALVPGTYVATITLEQSVYEVTCEIAATFGESDCTEPEQLEGSVEYIVDLSMLQTDPDEWDPDSPVGGLSLYALDRSQSRDDESYSANRGPRLVEIEVVRGDTVLIDEHYDVTYERDDDYRGDPRCGYCDILEERSATWDASALGGG